VIVSFRATADGADTTAVAHQTQESSRPRRLLDRPVGATDRGAIGTALYDRSDSTAVRKVQ